MTRLRSSVLAAALCAALSLSLSTAHAQVFVRQWGSQGSGPGQFTYPWGIGVDASGALADGRRFAGVRELKAILAANPRQLARNLLRQLIVYSTGSPVRFSDRAEVERLLDACAPDGYRTRDLIHALVQSKIFLGAH